MPSPFVRARSGCSRDGIAGMSVGRVRAARPEASRDAHARRARRSLHQVRAIFRDSCEHCHNEDKAKGGLLIKSYETLIAGGEHGSPIVPGKARRACSCR